jgi:hypothetical protein
LSRDHHPKIAFAKVRITIIEPTLLNILLDIEDLARSAEAGACRDLQRE